MNSALLPGIRMLLAGLCASLHVHPSADVLEGNAQALAAEADRPALGSLSLDAAALMTWEQHESGFQLDPKPQSWDARAGKSVGLLQQAPAVGHLSVYGQVTAWLSQARHGTRICPESPLAPLSGSCRGASKLADRRLAKAHDALADVLGLQD